MYINLPKLIHSNQIKRLMYSFTKMDRNYTWGTFQLPFKITYYSPNAWDLT